MPPSAAWQVQKADKLERKYGHFTHAFKIPQEYERKWDRVEIDRGVMKISFKPDADEEGLIIGEE